MTKGEKMKEIIKSIIIKEIPSGMIFDTHTIIEYLLQNDSDTYLENYEGKTSTELYHSYISQVISAIASEVGVKKLDEKSWSLNIRDNFSECACWKKVA